MTETEALALMKAPGDWRSNKPRGTVIQILVTSSCNLHCYNCTQLSQMERKHWVMTPEQFHQACQSLRGYQGVVGVFGGNPCMSKHFREYCDILRTHFPREQCGLWSNDPLTAENARKCRETFDVGVSNLNVHMSKRAYDLFKTYWPESRPFGLTQDSRHSPCYVAMRDVLTKPCPVCNGTGQRAWDDLMHLPDGRIGTHGVTVCKECGNTGKIYDEEKAWELISGCDINQRWSAGIGVFRGQLRAWFCEIAMAQSIAHQDEQDYPDTGLRVDRLYDDGEKQWWQLPMHSFTNQVRKHCHSCSVPLRGYGELSQCSSPESREQASVTHQSIYKPKRKDRRVELVTVPAQLGKPLEKVTAYLQNGGL